MLGLGPISNLCFLLIFINILKYFNVTCLSLFTPISLTNTYFKHKKKIGVWLGTFLLLSYSSLLPLFFCPSFSLFLPYHLSFCIAPTLFSSISFFFQSLSYLSLFNTPSPPSFSNSPSPLLSNYVQLSLSLSYEHLSFSVTTIPRPPLFNSPFPFFL